MSKKMQNISIQNVNIHNKVQKISQKEPEISNKIQGIEKQEVLVIDRSPFHPPLCEFCKGETRVYSVHAGVRYCKCRRCGWTFKR